MKNLEIIEAVLTMSKEFRVSEVDKNLYSSVKKTTEDLISKNPECKISELFESLRESTKIGLLKLIDGEDFNDTVNMLIDMAEKVADENDDPLSESQSSILFLFLKSGLTRCMISNSYRTSKQAITDIWNSMNGME